MNLLALDTSTRLTGWAAGDTAARPAFGAYGLPSTGPNLGQLSRAYGDWLVHMIQKYSADFVAYEEPILFVDREHTQALTHYKLVGLGFKTEDVCAALSVRCIRYTNVTLKHHFSGHGRAKKPEMMNVARQLGYRVRDDNEADALAIFSKTVHEHDPDNAHMWDRIGAAA